MDLPDDLEVGGTPTNEEAAKVKELIATLHQATGSDAEHGQPEPHPNGWDKSLATNGAHQEVEAAAH